MGEISIKTVKNIDEIDHIILPTTYTTKLQRYSRLTLHILDFHQKNFPGIPPPPLLLPSREYPYHGILHAIPNGIPYLLVTRRLFIENLVDIPAP